MNNRKKILLFSNDPGGANTIIPLISPLKEKGFDVRLFGRNSALEKYAKAKLLALDVNEYIDDIKPDAVEEFLVRESPDFIITGTSASDNTEKYLWQSAERLNTPSFAIMDQWLNYGIRFSRYTTSEIAKYKEDRMHPYLPSKILVMDDYARQEAVNEGLEPSRIIVTGQPYFETLLNEKINLSTERLNELRLSIGKEEDIIITFASEPVSKDYESIGSDHYWGFTEKTVFKELIEAAKIVSHECKRRLIVVLKLHPREDIDGYKKLIAPLKGEKVNIVIEKGVASSCDLILLSDLVIGMSSMFLIEAVILHKPVLSVLIGLCRENPFVLERKGILKSIIDRGELVTRLREVIVDNRQSKCEFDFIKNPVSNVILHMEKYLCQN